MAHAKNTNPRRKTRYKECWERGKANAKRREDANVQRQKANDELRSAGLPTAWERACDARRVRRSMVA